MAEGLRFLWRTESVRTLALLVAATNLLIGPLFLAVVVRAQGDLGAPAAQIGLVLSFYAAAAFAGSILAGWVRVRLRIGILLRAGIALIGVGMAVIAAAGSIVVVGVGLSIIAFTSAVFNIVQMSHRMSLIPNDLQGRVHGAFRSIAVGVGVAGTVLGGLVIENLGSSVQLFVAAGGCALIAVFARVSGAANAGT
jgi:MFS family permease